MAGSLQNFLAPPTAIYAEHAANLYKRLGMADHIPRKSLSLGKWYPIPNKCHQNCFEWVTLNPNDEIVRGWLCFDMSPIGFYRFASHSVIRTQKNQLIDITPTLTAVSQPFLIDSLDEFLYEECIHSLFAAHGYTFLDHQIQDNSSVLINT
jgi:hypothetical protein